LATIASEGGQRAITIWGGFGLFKSIGRFFARKAAVSAVEMIPSLGGGISKAALEAAANGGGETVTVVTNLTQAPQAGRALSVAAGEGAEALAKAAGDLHGGGQVFTAQIPKALIQLMERVQLAQSTITDMGNGVRATEIRFAPQATQFIVRFFK
jgi:hypothetical protein